MYQFLTIKMGMPSEVLLHAWFGNTWVCTSDPSAQPQQNKKRHYQFTVTTYNYICVANLSLLCFPPDIGGLAFTHRLHASALSISIT